MDRSRGTIANNPVLVSAGCFCIVRARRPAAERSRVGEALVVLAAAAAGWFWYDSMRARERAVEVGRAACERDGLQFLDETVLCTRTRPTRDADGRVRLRRMYRFEFSDDGVRRCAGSMVLLGARLESLEL